MKLPYKVLVIARHKISPDEQSGAQYYMLNALRDGFETVDYIDDMVPCRNPLKMYKRGFHYSWIIMAISKVFWSLLGKDYDWNRSITLSKYCSHIIETFLSCNDYDLLFVDKGYVELSFLKTNIPIIYSHDAVNIDLSEYGGPFSNAPAFCRRNARAMESMSVSRSSACVYSSHWAAESAIRNLKIPPRKVAVVNNGPYFSEEMISQASGNSTETKSDHCHLLFIGRDWFRKGGDIALKTAKALNDKSLNTSLTICGCVPPSDVNIPDYVKIFPALDKNNEDERRMLAALFMNSTFLILPTRAECCANVLIESLAFGLPAITTDTGGNRDVTKHNTTGYLMSLNDDAEQYAATIADCLNAENEIERLANNARYNYSKKFTWSHWTAEISTIAETILTRPIDT